MDVNKCYIYTFICVALGCVLMHAEAMKLWLSKVCYGFKTTHGHRVVHVVLIHAQTTFPMIFVTTKLGIHDSVVLWIHTY